MIVYDQIETPSVIALKPASTIAEIRNMRASVGATNNGNISAALSDLRHRGWTHPGTLATALYGLRSLGFIQVTREGGLRQGTRVPTLYRFTDLEVFEHPKLGVQACKATHGYLKFDTIADAGKALDAGIKQLREDGRRKQMTKIPPVRETYRIATGNVPEGRNIATLNVQGKRPSLR